MTVTLPMWVVALLIYAAFLMAWWWIDRRFLQPWTDRLIAWLVAGRERRRASRSLR